MGDDYVPELRETAETEEPAVSIAASDTTISDDALLPAQSDEDATPAEAPREPVLSLVKQIAAAQPEDRQDGDVIPVPHDDEADNSHEPVENAPDAVATASVAVDEEQHLSQDDHIPTRQEES